MIKEIELTNFKCFENIKLPTGNLTMLTGINGTGKSTVLQSLVLLKQSFERNRDMKVLYLNDEDYIQLGNAEDVLCSHAEEDCIKFGYHTDDSDYSFEYEHSGDRFSDMLLSKKVFDSTEFLMNNNIRYLSADRITPKRFYRIANADKLSRREFGSDGEFAIQYLLLNSDKDIDESLNFQYSTNRSLKAQVSYWLGKISNSAIPIIRVDEVQRIAELKYEFLLGETERSNTYSNINVGFGITYTLPFIVLLLSSTPGDILLIENPEAHLHPQGQVAMGQLLSFVAASGVQIILETHSDHILNGIRLSVKKGEISNDMVAINYFYQEKEKPFRHLVSNPKILRNGKLDKWPEGFFDEWENALLELL
ncbi:AAA family ATPase [Pseudobutyrivibrio sp.]|uniref:AAA family ATPase n=1 Tax=Pseudobutyrivibrio sp. TaxID=2014367 RepID=UPI001D657D9A|nr:DUF3696 domain-containing protein [Pseudobutyrivibrio sp.]MBE5912269.1 DUF3696 domain-containing protein [Pseudobutyrivibrio sp.]